MFQTILQALVPVVFVAGLGWIVGRLGVLDPQRIRSVTTFVVTVAFPAAFTWAVALMGTWAVVLPTSSSAALRRSQECLQ